MSLSTSDKPSEGFSELLKENMGNTKSEKGSRFEKSVIKVTYTNNTKTEKQIS